MKFEDLKVGMEVLFIRTDNKILWEGIVTEITDKDCTIIWKPHPPRWNREYVDTNKKDSFNLDNIIENKSKVFDKEMKKFLE